jgi:hypothetical protein
LKTFSINIGIGGDARSQLWHSLVMPSDMVKFETDRNRFIPNRSSEPFDIEITSPGYLAVVLGVPCPRNVAAVHEVSPSQYLVGFPIYLTADAGKFPPSRLWDLVFERISKLSEVIEANAVHIGFHVDNLPIKHEEMQEREFISAFIGSAERWRQGQGAGRKVTFDQSFT